MPLTKEQGEELVRLARNTVDDFVRGDDIARPGGGNEPFLKEVRGAFVTLKNRDGSLRGCIGFPYPIKELGEAVVEASISAAAYDPRFPKVEPTELDGLLVEVSALTKPEKLEWSSPKELPKRVRIGVDGLIVSNALTSGLLLPQVATEYKLSPEDFLSDTCLKAGLRADSWLTDKIVVQRFQAEVFSETSPRGKVKRELG
ncbi:MAG: TIGR00296 family protein [Thaumarchaeota archaeon]|nr:TIGR00296 family protein [Nitrososphaerota archaeon]